MHVVVGSRRATDRKQVGPYNGSQGVHVYTPGSTASASRTPTVAPSTSPSSASCQVGEPVEKRATLRPVDDPSVEGM